MCHSVMRKFHRLYSELYMSSLQTWTKWCAPSRKLQVGDICAIRTSEGAIKNNDPIRLAEVIDVRKGRDNEIRGAVLRYRQLCKNRKKYLPGRWTTVNRASQALSLLIPLEEIDKYNFLPACITEPESTADNANPTA